jgi:hypothetical protein
MVAVSRVGDRTADKSADWAIYTAEKTVGVASVGSWSRGSEMENVRNYTFLFGKAVQF